jgi:hypothetical protein
MKLRSLLKCALLCTVMLVPACYAQSAGVNCDAATGGKYTPGTQDWRTCYINSSIAMCSANPPQTFEGIVPKCGCNADCLGNSMYSSYGLRETVCNYENGHQWLPTGVSVQTCMNDWGCYTGQGTCS